MKLDDKLYLVRFNTDKLSHIKIANPSVCLQQCQDKPCTRFCPAHVYDWDEEEKRIAVGYEGCLECGTCLIGCPFGNIDWKYPRGGFGVSWKNG
ncbi:ferredoxin family protein [Desulfosporosinus meridiei]|uniref:Ferredoxin-like protein n=1 Tax=Desulfosporosinus meridiei (strain ATCC BAA-275 / DSM 13257 / KCTC 12902 / NCIMB 13706 / S10) TaxID=768704 RepID=J7J0E4_DESMD|nr:4Fe-4S dicluster domain-containing protein [Desulfosporosinus meridiei]AFQ44426.1 ferredoxin-like protein [Desulfosporosinus meridiei DSM 13257]